MLVKHGDAYHKPCDQSGASVSHDLRPACRTRAARRRHRRLLRLRGSQLLAILQPKQVYSRDLLLTHRTVTKVVPYVTLEHSEADRPREEDAVLLERPCLAPESHSVEKGCVEHRQATSVYLLEANAGHGSAGKVPPEGLVVSDSAVSLVEKDPPVGLVEKVPPVGLVEKVPPLGLVEKVPPLGLVVKVPPVGSAARDPVQSRIPLPVSQSLLPDNLSFAEAPCAPEVTAQKTIPSSRPCVLAGETGMGIVNGPRLARNAEIPSANGGIEHEGNTAFVSNALVSTGSHAKKDKVKVACRELLWYPTFYKRFECYHFLPEQAETRTMLLGKMKQQVVTGSNIMEDLCYWYLERIEDAVFTEDQMTEQAELTVRIIQDILKNDK